MLPEIGCLIGTAVKEMEERREAKHSAHLVLMDRALLNPRLFVMVQKLLSMGVYF